METSKIIGIAVLAILVISWIISFFIIIKHEKKEFNNGICPRCGERLEHTSTDSQGGRLYSCPKCNKYDVWISYGCVDKEYRKEELKKFYAEDGYGDRYGNKLD